MPQLDKFIFLSQLFWLVLFLSSFYLLLIILVLPNVLRTLKARRILLGRWSYLEPTAAPTPDRLLSTFGAGIEKAVSNHARAVHSFNPTPSLLLPPSFPTPRVPPVFSILPVFSIFSGYSVLPPLPRHSTTQPNVQFYLHNPVPLSPLCCSALLSVSSDRSFAPLILRWGSFLHPEIFAFGSAIPVLPSGSAHEVQLSEAEFDIPMIRRTIRGAGVTNLALLLPLMSLHFECLASEFLLWLDPALFMSSYSSLASLQLVKLQRASLMILQLRIIKSVEHAPVFSKVPSLLSSASAASSVKSRLKTYASLFPPGFYSCIFYTFYL